MPCREQFDAQPKEYRDSILPPSVRARVAVEAAHPAGWDRYVGDQGSVIGIDHFGASAPGGLVMEKFGFNVDNVVKHVESVLKG
jgi:transketolase